MTRLIITSILAVICLSGGIAFFIKKKKLAGVMFAVLGAELCTLAVGIVRFHGVKENIVILFSHGAITVTAIVFAIIIKIKYKIKFPKAVRRILIIVPICILALGGIIFGLRFTPLYRKAAENIKPFTHKDGISRSLYMNFYKSEIPGYTYNEPLEIKYFSKVLSRERRAQVVLPANYDENKKYPVLYLLHGLGGSDVTWLNKKADVIIKNMHYLYGCPEMIVVMPDSNINEDNSTAGMSYADKCKYFDRTEEELINSLMPYINENFSVYTDKEHTAIAGNSMGARNSLAIAFHHQDMFGYVGVFSTASVIKGEYAYFPPLIDELKIDERYGGFKTLMVMVGREDYVCGNVSYDLHEQLEEAGIDHIFYDVFGIHHNPVWQNGLYNFIKDVSEKMGMSK